jgi:hypothetical protein
MRVGDLQILQNALHDPILAAAAVQHIEGHIGGGRQRVGQSREVVIDIDRRHFEATFAQRFFRRRAGG